MHRLFAITISCVKYSLAILFQPCNISVADSSGVIMCPIVLTTSLRCCCKRVVGFKPHHTTAASIHSTTNFACVTMLFCLCVLGTSWCIREDPHGLGNYSEGGFWRQEGHPFWCPRRLHPRLPRGEEWHLCLVIAVIIVVIAVIVVISNVIVVAINVIVVTINVVVVITVIIVVHSNINSSSSVIA